MQISIEVNDIEEGEFSIRQSIGRAVIEGQDGGVEIYMDAGGLRYILDFEDGTPAVEVSIAVIANAVMEGRSAERNAFDDFIPFGEISVHLESETKLFPNLLAFEKALFEEWISPKDVDDGVVIDSNGKTLCMDGEGVWRCESLGSSDYTVERPITEASAQDAIERIGGANDRRALREENVR